MRFLLIGILPILFVSCYTRILPSKFGEPMTAHTEQPARAVAKLDFVKDDHIRLWRAMHGNNQVGTIDGILDYGDDLVFIVYFMDELIAEDVSSVKAAKSMIQSRFEEFVKSSVE